MSAVDLKGKFDDMMTRGKLLCAGITCRRCSEKLYEPVEQVQFVVFEKFLVPNSFMILGIVFSSALV